MILNQKLCVALIAILSMTLALESSNLDKSRDELDAKGTYKYRIVKVMEIEVKDESVIERENKIVCGELKKSEEQIAKLIKSELELRSENKNLRDSLNVKEIAIDILRGNLTNLENNLNEKNDEYGKLELLNEGNKNKIAELEKKHEKHLEALSINEKKIGELSEKSDKCETELGNLGKQNAILEDKLEHLSTNSTCCENIILAIDKIVKGNSVVLNECEQRVAQSNRELTNLKERENKQMSDNKEIIQSLESNITICNSNLVGKDAELGSLKSELVRYKQKLEHLPNSCDNCKNYSGLATIEVKGLSPFNVLCDSKIAGSGWTVIQRRIDGKVDFYRNWEEYKVGFGEVDRELWIGLEKLHRITNEQRYELYIHLVDRKNEQRYARYDNFKIGSEQTNFKLISLGKYTGNAGDSMTYHEGQQFSTYETDNDNHYKIHCAKQIRGAWWYKSCAFSNLNGNNFTCTMENSNELDDYGCIYWQNWHGRSYSLKFVQMMIRPFKAEF